MSLLGGAVVELMRGVVEAGLGSVVSSLYGWGVVLRDRHFLLMLFFQHKRLRTAPALSKSL